MTTTYLGQRIWLPDGQVLTGDFDKFALLGLPIIYRVIYYSPSGRQMQIADHYLEVDTDFGVLRRTVFDDQLVEMKQKYPDGVFIPGEWIADDRWYAIKEDAEEAKEWLSGKEWKLDN